MKRCQIGTMNHDEANNLHAECYGMIGALLNQLTKVRGHLMGNSIIDDEEMVRELDHILR